MSKDMYFFQAGIRLFGLLTYYTGVSNTISACDSNSRNRDNFHSLSLRLVVSISTGVRSRLGHGVVKSPWIRISKI